MKENYEFPEVDESDLIYNDEDLILEIAENTYWRIRAEQMIKKGLEKVVLKKPKVKRKRNVSDSRYRAFYQEANEFSLDIGADSNGKLSLLRKYFPGRFGNEGKQPVCDMDFLELGILFNKIVKYSKVRTNQ